MTGRVTLVLGEDRVEVSREDLIRKSEYFAALFSRNFSDHQIFEHRINYDIQIDTLWTFVDLVSDHVAPVIGDRRHVKPSLAKYVGDSADFEGLLQLLQFSVLFISETLIDDLTDLIACHWLVPQKCVQIWLLARDLVLVTLKDLAKATCVDRLQDIPESSLLELPGEDFIELVGNVHVKVSETVPFKLVQQWVKHNVPPGESNAFESRYPFTLMRGDASLHSLTNLYEDQYWKHNIQCIVVHKRSRNDDVKCIYAWDGTTFSEMIELPRSLTFSTNDIVGMRVVSRGFDIYIVGGEYGEGSRNYLKEIWRYSMISRTWYYVTSLRLPRRNVAIVFLNENLFLISNRVSSLHKSSRIDVFNVHTGKWKDVEYIPSPINDESVICTGQNTIFLHERGSVYSYNVDDNSWVCKNDDWEGFFDITLDENGDLTEDVSGVDARFLMATGNYMYILGWYDEKEVVEEMEANGYPPYRIFLVQNFEELDSSYIGECTTRFVDQVANGPYLFGFSHENDTVCIEEIRLCREQVAESRIAYREKMSDIKDLCPENTINCFNVYNPKSLNQLFVLEENAM